jgi:hypothetical protein
MNRDLRKYARNTNVRLVFGFIVLLLFLGDGLIYLIYGREAGVLGLLCILGGLAPIGLIAIVLSLLDYFVRKANE